MLGKLYLNDVERSMTTVVGAFNPIEKYEAKLIISPTTGEQKIETTTYINNAAG